MDDESQNTINSKTTNVVSSKITLSIVNPALIQHPVADSLLYKFLKQFNIDKREQMPDIDQVFLLNIEDTVKTIHRNGKHLWFIHLNSKVIGYVTVAWQCWPVVKAVHISDFFITPQYRGQGLGRQSMAVILEKLFEYYPEAERVALAVLSDNVNAKSLYESMGFKTRMETMILEKNA